MADIIDDLKDLHKQATTERSHYYVASCCKKAMEEIELLREMLDNRNEFIAEKGLWKDLGVYLSKPHAHS